MRLLKGILISVLSRRKGPSLIHNSNAGIIICRNDAKNIVHPSHGKNQSLVFVENPRFVIVQIINKVYKKKSPSGISKDASISETQRLALIVT